MKVLGTEQVHKVEITENERQLIILALEKLEASITKENIMYTDVKVFLAKWKVFLP